MNQSENRSSRDEDAEEESGWTTYLEDFSLMNNQRENYRSSCFSEDHSFGQSDAASSHHSACKNTNYFSPKRLNLKKLPRNKKINDPDLEDTASSPVNSPKVSNFKQMEINYRRTENNCRNFVGNEGSSRQFLEMQSIVERGNIGYTDLKKKKGLCLVPLSMLVNYQG